MTEFEVGGQEYRAEKMNAETAAHVLRRVLPVVGALIPAVQSIRATGADNADFAAMAAPLADAIADLPDDRWNYVMRACLSVTARKSGGVLTPVYTGSRMMFDDIEMPEMITIVAQVLVANLGPFMQGSRWASLPGVGTLISKP